MPSVAQPFNRPRSQRLLRAAIVIVSTFTGVCLLTSSVLAAAPDATYPILSSLASPAASMPTALPSQSPLPATLPATIFVKPTTSPSLLPSVTPLASSRPTPQPAPKSISRMRPAPKAPPAKKPAPPKTATSPVSFKGANHFWFPSLGINQHVYAWPCAGGSIPDKVYSWGCEGTNNVYMLGHAYGVFKPLHDAYHSGALHVGLIAYYAAGDGQVHAYRVTQVRHVLGADYKQWSTWAVGSQSSPSLTLQTCDGATSNWRIEVRLVQIP